MDAYKYDAFGGPRGGWGSDHNIYKYGGGWGYITDPSGMLQLGHRFYWPEIGRFVSQDPIGDGIDWYAYVGNNPLRNIDPEGLHGGCPGKDHAKKCKRDWKHDMADCEGKKPSLGRAGVITGGGTAVGAATGATAALCGTGGLALGPATGLGALIGTVGGAVSAGIDAATGAFGYKKCKKAADAAYDACMASFKK